MPSPSSKKRKVIGSVQRAINIINLFDSQSQELGTTEIARALDLPKSTAAGLLFTLEVNDYLDRNPENRKYRLGLKLAERGGMLLNQIGLRRIASPYLEELRDWCNESVNLAIHDHDEVLYIERLLGTNTLGMRSEIGKREPAHSTALGKAVLSCLPDEDIEKFITRHDLASITPNTITNRERFLMELRETQIRGYAIDDEENELGGRCVAAAILDYGGHPIAAISISVPLQRLPRQKIPIYGKKTKDVASEISRQLGYSQGDE